jgi:Protein of unknown function (DUF3224)
MAMSRTQKAAGAATLDIKFTIKAWDENPFRELPEGQKVTQASVPLSVADSRIEADASFSSLMHYTSDGASTYIGMLAVDGRLDGRQGSFVLMGNGTYDGTTARLDFSIVEGSGTGELAGIRGTATSVSTHEDFPHMPVTLNYEVD